MLGDQQLEAGQTACLAQLGLASLLLLGPAEAAGEVDDPPAGVAKGHQRRWGSDQLVVWVRREVQRDVRHR